MIIIRHLLFWWARAIRKALVHLTSETRIWPIYDCTTILITPFYMLVGGALGYFLFAGHDPIRHVVAIGICYALGFLIDVYETVFCAAQPLA